ncbi:MAG: heavy metal translocating P-type ATPase, partial [Lachnospiraceae bacterium]|nr:heavy metal translocating P-type ATPase [Lachnospiraceae bacterium]
MKCTYPIDGLSCAHCAAKIEDAIRRLEGVQDASVNVISKKLTIVADDRDQQKLLKKANQIMHSIEPSASVRETDEQRERKEHMLVLARIVFAFILSAVIFLLPIQGMPRLLCFLVPYLLVGGDVLFNALKNLIHGRIFDEKFLMSVATAGAFAIGKYTEGVAVMLFYQLGELFQEIAVGRSRRSISSLIDIRPDTATVIRNGGETIVSPETVELGEEIVIRPGERVALDAMVISGASSLDTAALTGESMPRDVSTGDAIISGSVNLTGVLHAKVTSLYQDSTVSRIMDLVENSSEKKSRTEGFISKFARWYTPCVVACAAIL